MRTPTREQLLHSLYEAAELEQDLMCTYLYAAFSLKSGDDGGLASNEVDAIARWRRAIVQIAREEMGHLVAVWNLTAALGGAPHFGRVNFPVDAGVLPSSVVVRLAPFSADALQHFLYLERPASSVEPDGPGFEHALDYHRGVPRERVTPQARDYTTVGAFYAALADDLRAFAQEHGDAGAFLGDPALQLTATEAELIGIEPVICVKTALAAFAAIVEQGEGSPAHAVDSHYHRFVAIRDELAALHAANPAFAPAFPAAHNPVLRPPPRPEGRVWIEDEAAAQVVDLANAVYGLMLRLLAYAYVVPRPAPHKQVSVDLALGLMRVLSPLAERAARLPAGPSNPHCNAGVSFTALRDAAALVAGPSTPRFFIERFAQLRDAAGAIDGTDARVASAVRLLRDLETRAIRDFAASESEGAPREAARSPVVRLPIVPPTPTVRDGVEAIEGRALTLIYEGARCIHARFCVTGAPQVFLANVKGPWIHPDAMDAAHLVEIAHACPSGAIRYARKDGRPDEAAPPVNLVTIRENGPYAVRADLRIEGQAPRFRATLCRCGASKAKPFCDGSHHAIDFGATGEPLTESADMLEVRDGPLAIDPQLDGPLRVRGNLEITSGTGRVVARVARATLCRCGASNSKPFCDGSHQRIGFRSS